MYMLLTSIRRRRRDIRYVSVVTFIAVLFTVGINLFQDIMNQYVMEQNYQNYGNWILSAVNMRLEHPYLETEGVCTTGPVLVNEEGETTYIYLGTMDENGLSIGNISLYEGRMPESNDEIVMDLVSLAKLGYSYEIGQTIHILYAVKDEDGASVIQQSSYQLVGTIKSFAAQWCSKSQYPLPNVLVTAEEMQSYESSHQTYFYSLDQEYANLDAAEFANTLIKEYPTSIVYNSYVYENQIWGSAEGFRNASYVMIAIAVLAISYLFSSYVSKRTGVYYRYRCMGASKRQIRRMIAIEGMYATFPVTAAGIVLPYLIGFTVCKVLAKTKQLSDFYVFDAALFLRQVIAIVLVLVIAIIWAMLGAQKRNPIQNTGVIRKRGFKKLRKMAARAKHPERDFGKRYNRLHPAQQLFMTLFSVLVCGGLTFCLQNIYYILNTTYYAYQTYPDFSMTKKTDYYDMYDGASAAMYEELGLAVGIDEIETKIYDGRHRLKWEGMENSTLLRTIKEVGYEDYSILFNYFKDDTVARGIVKEKGNGEKLDWESWKAGEQVIVLLASVYEQVDWDEYFEPISTRIEVYDQTLQAGDTIEIQGSGATVTVAAVYYVSDIEYSPEYSVRDITIIASSALGEKIAALEGETFQENYLEVWFNPLSSYEATDKQLAAVARRYGFSYESNAELRRVLYSTVLRTIGIYGTVFILLLSVYIVLQKNFISSRGHYQREQYRLLKRLGMEDGLYLRLNLWAKLREYLWLYAGVAAGYGMMAFTQYRAYATELLSNGGRISCRLINDFTADKRLLTLSYLVYNMGHVWFIVMATIVLLIMLLNSFLAIRRSMKDEEHEKMEKK